MSRQQLLEVIKFFVIAVTPLVVLSRQDLAPTSAQAWVNTLWSMLHAFTVAFNFVGMTKVAQEMEDPFGIDANDLPLISMHDELNFRLDALLHQKPPKADFAYNPHSKFTQAGRDRMFGDLGSGPAPAAPGPISTSFSSLATLAASSDRPAQLSVPGGPKGGGGGGGGGRVGGGCYDRLASPGVSSPAPDGATPRSDSPASSSGRPRSSTRTRAAQKCAKWTKAVSVQSAKLQV